jgi:O-antigen/teichoic acid export membrane protein
MEERVATSGDDVLDTTRAGPLVIQGGLLRGAGFVANTLIALLGIALVTRHLGVADFGRFQTILSLITVVGTVTDAGMATLGLREYSQRTAGERDRLMEALLGLRLVLTLIGAAIAVAIAIAVGYDWDLALGTALAGIGLTLTVVQTTLTIPLAAEMRNMAFTMIDLLRQVLTVAGYVVLVVLGAGVAAFLGVTVPVGIVMLVAAALLVRGKVPLRPAFRLADWRRLARAAAAFAMATAVGTIYLYTAQILTAVVTDPRETGLFSASFRVFMVGAMIPGMLVAVAFPLLSRAARDDSARLAYALQRLVDTTAILGFGTALGLVVAAPVVIEVMAGDGFADAVPVLRIHAITLVATFLLSPFGFALLSLHAHREILGANLVALAVMLTAVVILARAMGSEGAALGAVLGELTLLVGYLVGLRRAAPMVVPSPGRPARAFAAAAFAGGIGLIPSLSTWAAAVIALIAYAGLVILLRAVPDELLEILPWRRRAR